MPVALVVAAHIFLRRLAVETATFRLNFYRVTPGRAAEQAVEQHILVREPGTTRTTYVTVQL